MTNLFVAKLLRVLDCIAYTDQPRRQVDSVLELSASGIPSPARGDKYVCRLIYVPHRHLHSRSHRSSLYTLFTPSNDPDMSLTFFTEPFYSLSDFDRLFDEAFNARTSPLAAHHQNENSAVRPLRPR